MKLKAFFIIFKELSLNQIETTFSEDESPNLNKWENSLVWFAGSFQRSWLKYMRQTLVLV